MGTGKGEGEERQKTALVIYIFYTLSSSSSFSSGRIQIICEIHNICACISRTLSLSKDYVFWPVECMHKFRPSVYRAHTRSPSAGLDWRTRPSVRPVCPLVSSTSGRIMILLRRTLQQSSSNGAVFAIYYYYDYMASRALSLGVVWYDQPPHAAKRRAACQMSLAIPRVCTIKHNGGIRLWFVGRSGGN